MLESRLHTSATSRMLRNARVTALLARSNTLSIIPLSGHISVPRRCHLLVSSRTFSSSRTSCSTAQDGPVSWTNVREIVRPSATWLAPEGSKFDQQQVLDQLPELKEQGEDLPVVLLLVTPKLAHLFENKHSFHSRVINKLYGKSAQGTLRQSIVGVVDAMPVLGKTHESLKPEVHGTEGIAICVSPGFDVVPALWRDAPQPLISMAARFPFFDGERHVTISWSGGVANTTFINGRQHTLFLQNWWNRDGAKWLSEPNRQNLSRVSIQSYVNRIGNVMQVALNSSMIKLTDPKVIMSSMGNIVRQVATSDGKELAASHELETIVPKMLKELQKTTPTGDLRVFALVYPPELGKRNPFEERIFEGVPKETAMRLQEYNAKLLTLLARGARLYRVTSGGAGWGNKAGLLALEPVTELGASAIEPDFPSFVFEQSQDVRMPGSADLFPPGHIVQFIGTFHDMEGYKKDAVTIDATERTVKDSPSSLVDWTNAENEQLLCLGNVVLPETHQHTALEDVDQNSTVAASSGARATPNLIFRPNRFGFLTASALGLSAQASSLTVGQRARLGISGTAELDASYKHTSLVELPNSYFLSTFAAGGKVTEIAARNYIGSRHSKEPRIIINSTNLAHYLTKEESRTFASQRLRDAERLLNDSFEVMRKKRDAERPVTKSHLAMRRKSARRWEEDTARKQPARTPKEDATRKKLAQTRKEDATRKFRRTAVELKPTVRTHGSQARHEEILRYTRTPQAAKEDKSASSTARIKKHPGAKGLPERQVPRTKRSMMQRSKGLIAKGVTSLRVIFDATGRASLPEHSTDEIHRPPFRWTPTDLPEGLTEVFSNQPRNPSVPADKRAAGLMSLSTNKPEVPWDHEPTEPQKDLRVRRVVSTQVSEKQDMPSLGQKSMIFRVYSKEDVIGNEIEGKVVVALTTDL